MKTKKVLIEFEFVTELNNEAIEATIKEAIKSEVPATKLEIRV